MIINTNDTGLRVELHGHEQIWAMRAKIDIAREDIKNIRFEPVFKEWRKWEVRIPGTAVPWLLFSGSYWTEEGWDFLFIKKPRGIIKPVANDVLVIETNQNKYSRIIVSLDPIDARRIIKWWNKKTKLPKATNQTDSHSLKKKTIKSRLRGKILKRKD